MTSNEPDVTNDDHQPVSPLVCTPDVVASAMAVPPHAPHTFPDGPVARLIDAPASAERLRLTEAEIRDFAIHGKHVSGDYGRVFMESDVERIITARVRDASAATTTPHAYGVETLWNRGGSYERWGLAMEMEDVRQPLDRDDAAELMALMIENGHAPDAVRLVGVVVLDSTHDDALRPLRAAATEGEAHE